MEKYRILIIDDEEEIHEAIKTLLVPHKSSTQEEGDLDPFKNSDTKKKVDPYEGLDLEIQDAYQGQEGIEIYKNALEKGRPFHLVLCDMRMPPGIDGKETLKQMSNYSDEIIALVCTAYSDFSIDDIRTGMNQNPYLGWIEKPFSKSDFIEMVNLKLEVAREVFD